jgi:hypothetical protein
MYRAAYPIVLLTVALLGCARSNSDAYYRAANAPDQATTDERACRNEATQVARARSRDDARILEDRTASYSSGTIYSSDLNINRYEQLASTERENIRDLTRACMADRGYRLLHDD